MPTITSFQINNFKGIESLTVDFARDLSPVTMLIGLNESGKTTILEALSYFITQDESASSLFEGVHSRADVGKMIPIHQKAAFTGNVEIIANVLWTDEDFDEIDQIAASMNLAVDRNSLGSGLRAIREYSFKDSVFMKFMNLYSLEPYVKSPNDDQYAPYVRPDRKGADDLWLKLVVYVRNALPSIVYFPTFLVDMPAFIYLKEHENETHVNRYYRNVFKELIESVGGNLSLEDHVITRIEEFQKKDNSPFWLSIFFGSPTKSLVDSVFQKMANAVTREVIGSWRNVFKRPSGAKSVLIEWNVDAQRSNLPYAAFYVSDGEARYSVSERSLGFRWFFSFLLFTAFKEKKTKPTIFLFDEPAANLHAKAQAELLKNFDRIASSGNKIIYSTHSHHMINPRWLSSAYIVENEAINYDSHDEFQLDSKVTNITMNKYRNFVAQYPSRTSYFQPVVEKLEYVAPEVIGQAPFLLVEGISDYSFFKAIRMMGGDRFPSISLIPGSGAGASGPLISYLIGRGERFLMLLDDDLAGKKAARRYKEDWYLADEQVKTVGEIIESYQGKRLESLVSPETKAMIAEKRSITKTSKKDIGLFFAECIATGDFDGIGISSETLSAGNEILAACEALLSS